MLYYKHIFSLYMQKKYLEILVDRQNEKGPDIFHEILVILHKAYSGKNNWDSFTFEVTKLWNRIRFFIICSEKYSWFLKNQIYAHFNNVEIYEISDYLEAIPNDKISVWKIGVSKHYLYSLKTFEDPSVSVWKLGVIDPFSSLTWALSKTWKYTLNTFQVNFRPVNSKNWKKDAKKKIQILSSDSPQFIKDLLLHPGFPYLKLIFSPFILLAKFLRLILWIWASQEADNTQVLERESQDLRSDLQDNPDSIDPKFLPKLRSEWFEIDVNLICAWEDQFEVEASIKEIASTLSVYSNFGQNSFKLDYISHEVIDIESAKQRKITRWNIVSSAELSWLVHLPTSYVTTPYINWVSSRAFEPPSNLPIIDPDLDDDIHPQSILTPVWKTNFRGTDMSFGISPDDRRRHMYIIGKTWMWKSVLLENMIMDDIHKGRWVAVIDPHGDLAEWIIGLIPKSRTNQTIIFDPSDTDWPIAFNMLENISDDQRSFVASW